MYTQRNSFKEKNQGITLIALIITIIVLLILAGITIALIMGDNGILNRAGESKTATEIAEEIQEIKLAILSIKTEKQDTNASVSAKEVEVEINKSEANKVISHGDYVKYNQSGREYLIDENGVSGPIEVEEVTDTNPGEFAGSGTESDPYRIESIEDLVALSNNVNSGESYEGKYFILTVSLDFYSENSYALASSLEEGGLMDQLTSGEGFRHIGGDWWYTLDTTTYQKLEEDTYRFSATFDGQEHSISNLYTNRSRTVVTENISDTVKKYSMFDDSGSLFGKSYGNIINLTVDGANITSSYSASGIAKYSFGIMDNCSFSGKLNVSTYGAGIAIFNYGTVSNCNSSGTMEGKGSMGGICCYTYEGGTIENSTNSIAMTNIEGYGVGGICYSCDDTSSITNCSNAADIYAEIAQSNTYYLPKVGGICAATDGDITYCYNTGNITQYGYRTYPGGIAGYTEGNIRKCYNTGNINTNGGYATRSGGIAGTVQASLSIEDCYNTGNLTVESPAVYTKAAGIAGEVATSSAVNITNCYNTGNIGGVGTGYLRIGGLVGECKNNVTLTNSYYLDTSCSKMYSNVAPTIVNSSSKTESEMKTAEFLGLINSNASWQLDTNANNGYPSLIWN